jgi:DNA-binding CsgD family transcriptional regulator
VHTESRGTLSERSVICPVLIGREGALGSVRAVLDRARGGAGNILLVAGEAGIGKSRMLRETTAEARDRGFVVLKGACFEADRAAPYAPLLDLVRELSATASPMAVAHLLAPAAAELVRAFPELASIFPDLPPHEALDSEHERRRLFHGVAETIARLGRTQPVMLAIEDVHWGDEASLELFLHLARRISAQPVTLALSYRSDEVAPPLARLLAELDRTRIATEINLTRFTGAELTTMLAAIFDGAGPGGAFVATIFALTEGNPFFVEEVLKALVSAGDVARRADGVWHARPLTRVQAPRTAVEAVRRRLSGLTVPARDVASMAAVAGRRFDFALLHALTGEDERKLLGHIRELIGAQLVTEESPDRFAFRHALTREAIVGELLARERAALHRAVADALEKQGGPPEAFAEALAYHAYGARDWPRALAASARAARHALALHAPREALAHLDRALDAATHAGVAPDATLRLARGRALETLGDLHGAHDDFCAALEAAQRDKRDRDAWEALHALGMLWAARDYARAGEYRGQALALARSIGDASLVARSLNRVANWHVNLEQPAPARRDHEEALALFERLGDQRGVAETVDLLAMTHFIAGDMVEAAKHYERAVALHEAIGERRGLASALALLCLCDGSMHTSCTAFGRTAIAAEVITGDRPVRLTREIGWRAGEAFALYLLGDAQAWRGAYDRALPLVRESLAIAEEMEHLQWQCGASRALGMTLLDLQAPIAARAPLEHAHAIALRLGSRTWTRWAAAPLAIALARLDECEAARAVLDDATVPSPIGRQALRPGDEDSPTLGERYLALARAEVALEEEMPALALEIADARLAAESGPVLRFTLVRALALIALDEVDAAEDALSQAREEAVAQEALPLLWRVQAATGQLRRRQRRRAEARQAFDDARATASALAERVADTGLRETFVAAVDTLAPAGPSPTARQKVKATYGGLTSRERDVARLVAQGKTNRGIARALGIGERTVEGYVAAALSKLGFAARAQLAAWTVETGLDEVSTKR